MPRAWPRFRRSGSVPAGAWLPRLGVHSNGSSHLPPACLRAAFVWDNHAAPNFRCNSEPQASSFATARWCPLLAPRTTICLRPSRLLTTATLALGARHAPPPAPRFPIGRPARRAAIPPLLAFMIATSWMSFRGRHGTTAGATIALVPRYRSSHWWVWLGCDRAGGAGASYGRVAQWSLLSRWGMLAES